MGAFVLEAEDESVCNDISSSEVSVESSWIRRFNIGELSLPEDLAFFLEVLSADDSLERLLCVVDSTGNVS